MGKAISRKAVIRISNLQLRAIIGANKWERHSLQDIVINVAMEFDAGKACESDDLCDTLDYKRVKRSIIALVEKSRYKLLETLTAQILKTVMKDKLVLAATIRIDKPHALRFAQSVSVEMRAQRDA